MPLDEVEPPGTGEVAHSRTASLLGWAVFQGAKDPYIGVVAGWVFMPYFVTHVLGDPLRGQALVSRMAVAAGVFTALTAPLLGASLDRYGPRKPLLALLVAAATGLIALLWGITPDLPNGRALGLLLFGAITVMMAYIETIHGSLLPIAVAPRRRSLASGLAFSAGSVTILATALALLLGALLPGEIHWRGVPAHPWFGLDAARFETVRISAPVTAILLAGLSAPLFILSADAPRTALPIRAAFLNGAAALWGLIRQARDYPGLMTYLISRTLLMDAGNTFIALGGIYAAGVMRWTPVELALYGVSGALAGSFGGVLAATLDRRLGALAALQVQTILSLAAMLCALGQSPGKLFCVFRTPMAPMWAGPVIRSAPDLCFLLSTTLVWLMLIGSYSSSRALLADLAPPGKVGLAFGLASLSGAATVWLGPLLVGLATTGFHSQQIGFLPLAVVMLLGVWVLSAGGGARSKAPRSGV